MVVSARLAALTCVLAVACAAPEATWHGDVAPVVDAKCAGCHREGDIAPFPLTTHEEVASVADIVADSVASGRMPPWQAADGCNDYANSTALTPDEKALLLDWLADGAPEGRERDAVDAEPDDGARFEPDRILELPDAYTPTALDDYRCQIIDLDLEAPMFVTGFGAIPDRREIVHHVIAYTIDAAKRADFEAMDAADRGPGWACYGGPTADGYVFEDSVDLSELSLAELLAAFTSGEGIEALGGFGWMGSWAPGGSGSAFPAGTGLSVEPGDFVVVQMHYNTASGSVPDRSAIGITLESSVASPAIVVPYADPAWVIDLPLLGDPMTIPAGADDVEHSTGMDSFGPLFQYVRSELALPDESPLSIRSVAHHMHTLGKRGRQVVRHDGGDETCLVDIPDWDFDWQSRYEFVEPVTMRYADEVRLTCAFDNTADNQPVVDGAIATPIDVEWGEGTRDEMCLGILYLTGP